MVRGQPMQFVEVDSDGKLIFHREVLDTVVNLCGDLPLAIYTVAGEFRQGKTTILNIFLAFNHFREEGEDWRNYKNVQLTGFEARGGSIKVTNGIWIWSKPFFSEDSSGEKVAIILIDTQGTFDQDTSSAVNSFIIGFSLAVSSILMYNNKEQISSHDLDSLTTFASTFMPIIQNFQTLLFLIRDWDDEERFPWGSKGGDMMSTDLLNPVASIGAVSRAGIEGMFQSVTGFLLPRPGIVIERAKRGPILIGDMDSDFERHVDELCKDIFIRNVKPLVYGDRGMDRNDLLAFIDRLITAYERGRIMDPGFHLNAFRASSAKKIKDEMVAEYQERMRSAIMEEKSRLRMNGIESHCCVEGRKILFNSIKIQYVDMFFYRRTDYRIRCRIIELFREKTAHLGKQDTIKAQLDEELWEWYSDHEKMDARECVFI